MRKMAIAIMTFTDCANLRTRKKEVGFPFDKNGFRRDAWHHAVQSGCSLYSQFFVRQIQCNARLGRITVFAVAKEPNGRVQHHYNSHADVEHTGTPDEMLWSFHVVFQRHHLWYTDRIKTTKLLNTGLILYSVTGRCSDTDIVYAIQKFMYNKSLFSLQWENSNVFRMSILTINMYLI